MPDCRDAIEQRVKMVHRLDGEMAMLFTNPRPAKPEPNELCTTESTESTEKIE